MLNEYQKHVEQRAQKGLPPLALNAEQVSALVELLKQSTSDSDTLLDLLINRVPPGVDEAAYVKAGFLADIAKENVASSYIVPVRATPVRLHRA